MAHANYKLMSETPERLVLWDQGPWTRHPTITNDAEHVVAELHAAGNLPTGRELWYYDSDARLSAIVHEGGKFVGFRDVS